LKQTCVQDLEDEFFKLHEEAEVARERETKAAIKIQARCRGVMTRNRKRSLTDSVNLIQRMFRGHLGRKRFGEYQRVKARAEREEFFYKAAAVIQRIWRGYAVRKFTCDFYGRKRWLENVLKVSEDLRVEMQEKYLQQLQDEEAKAQMEYMNRFRTDIKGKHHLTSTRARPGVFNSPYAFAHGGKPRDSLKGVTVEQHLKETMRAMVRSRPKHKEMMEALSPTNYGSPKRRVSPRKLKVTVEKPSFYTSVHKEALFADYEVKTQKCSL